MSDAYNYLPSFFSENPKAGELNYDQLQARRKIAMALATRNRPYPKTIGEGLTALGEGLGEGMNLAALQRAEGRQTATDAEGAARLRGDAPAAATPGQTSSVDGSTMNALALASPEDTANALAAAPPEVAKSVPPQVKLASMSVEEFAQRTKRNESGGHPDPYRAIGPRSRRDDYPYGAYQVMGENIPKWTKTYLGKEMTPAEFLADDKAQDQVALGQGGKYLAKYGPIGAAEAWFAGEKGRIEGRSTRKDTLGTHIDEYVRRFNIPLVSRDQVAASAVNAPAAAPSMALAEQEAAQQPVQLASLGGMPTPDTAPAPDPAARDMIAQALAAQQQPAPSPPQQVAQAAPLPVQPVPVQAQVIPKAPAQEVRPTPAGPEPKLRDYIEGDPALKRQMDAARDVARNPRYRDDLRTQAQKQYEELEKRANDAFKNQWTIWHERTKTEDEFRLKAEERQRARETHQTAQQKTITGASTAPQPVDPRVLGTDLSPQRTRIPVPPSKPPGVSEEAWSKEQVPLLSKAVEAVDKSTPMFEDAIKTIQLARQHPGREWGVGATGSIAQQLPWTDAAGFGRIMDQIKGKNFLAGYQQLKGGGSITEIEGTKTEQAQARVSTAQKKEDWEDAMLDLEKSLRRDMELAQRKINAPVTAWRAPGDNSSYAPDIGQRRGNNEYIGGDPSDPMSWKRAR